MTHEQIGRFRKEAIPLAAVIAAIGLAWTMGRDVISSRDAILANCHAIDNRLTSAERWITMHEAVDNQFREQVADLMELVRDLKKGQER